MPHLPGIGTNTSTTDPALAASCSRSRIDGLSGRAVLLGVVSGTLWGLFSMLAKEVVDRLGDGIWALLRTPENVTGAL
jgi:hypothetical protein